MPQTLLALLALVLASFLTFNQQQQTVRSQTNMIQSEVELAGAGVASEVMALIESKSFDEFSTPDKIYAAQAIPSSADEFTSAGSFGQESGCDLQVPTNTPSCDDIDDVDGTDWQAYSIELASELERDPVTGAPIVGGTIRTRELDFEVRVEVYYVDNPESMVAASGRTFHKRVLLDIRSDHVYGDEANGLIRFTRVVSYDPIKAEMDYENTEGYGPIGDEEVANGGTNETGV